MATHEIKVTPERARIFAYTIYRDIVAYAESHQEEYQQFLQQEEEIINGDAKASH